MLRLKSGKKPCKSFFGIIGRSGVMQKVYDVIKKVAETNATVLVTGESGTGKELPKATTVNPIARGVTLSLWARDEAPSTRKSAPFIKTTNPIMKNKNVSIAVTIYIF
jgi:transcriptional regulator with AAA-type ATPase domain